MNERLVKCCGDQAPSNEVVWRWAGVFKRVQLSLEMRRAHFLGRYDDLQKSTNKILRQENDQA